MPAFARCVLFTGETKGLKPGLWCQYILVFSLFHLALKSQRVETVSEFFGILCKPWLLEHSCSGSQIGWPNQFSLAEIWQERSAFLFGIWVKVVLFMPLTITLCVCVCGGVRYIKEGFPTTSATYPLAFTVFLGRYGDSRYGSDNQNFTEYWRIPCWPPHPTP